MEGWLSSCEPLGFKELSASDSFPNGRDCAPDDVWGLRDDDFPDLGVLVDDNDRVGVGTRGEPDVVDELDVEMVEEEERGGVLPRLRRSKKPSALVPLVGGLEEDASLRCPLLGCGRLVDLGGRLACSLKSSPGYTIATGSGGRSDRGCGELDSFDGSAAAHGKDSICIRSDALIVQTGNSRSSSLNVSLPPDAVVNVI